MKVKIKVIPVRGTPATTSLDQEVTWAIRPSSTNGMKILALLACRHRHRDHRSRARPRVHP
jgi:hypothetical protein